MNRPYYNTNGLTGEQKQLARQKAASQEQAVLDLFAKNPAAQATASQILRGCFKYNLLHPNTPITSVRRAISNLSADGKLVKLPLTIKGPYNRPEFLFMLNPSKIDERSV